MLVSRALLRDDASPASARHADAPPKPSFTAAARDGALLALGALAFCGLFGEGAMSDWSALTAALARRLAPGACPGQRAPREEPRGVELREETVGVVGAGLLCHGVPSPR